MIEKTTTICAYFKGDAPLHNTPYHNTISLRTHPARARIRTSPKFIEFVISDQQKRIETSNIHHPPPPATNPHHGQRRPPICVTLNADRNLSINNNTCDTRMSHRRYKLALLCNNSLIFIFFFSKFIYQTKQSKQYSDMVMNHHNGEDSNI